MHPVFPTITDQPACDLDGNLRTYRIAVERQPLPAPPFHISDGKNAIVQLRVSADLREPGRVPAEGEAEEVAAEPPQTPTSTPTNIELGFPVEFTVDVCCGFDYLGVINGVGWHTAECSDGAPDAWQVASVDGLLDLELLMTECPAPTLTATAAGQRLHYLPGPDAGDPCD